MFAQFKSSFSPCFTSFDRRTDLLQSMSQDLLGTEFALHNSCESQIQFQGIFYFQVCIFQQFSTRYMMIHGLMFSHFLGKLLWLNFFYHFLPASVFYFWL